MDKQVDIRENIVIAGLGAAGARLANLLLKSLDEKRYNIVVTNPRPFYILYPATARLIVSDVDDLQEKVFIPIEAILKGKGKFIQAKVAEFSEYEDRKGGLVKLDNGESVEYRVLVLSTGASWDHPLNIPESKEDINEWLAKSRNRFEKAESVILVGAGAVGAELAGEILDVWPKKRVTIVHGDSLPINAAYPDKFRRAVASSLKARGVELILGDYLDAIPAEGVTEVVTRNGRKLKGDLIISTRGQQFNTGFIGASLGKEVLSARGLVNIEKTFQVQKRKDVFAIGDIIEVAEQKQTAKANKHAELVAKNIVAHLEGRALAEYKGQPEMIIVTNGRSGGVAYLGILWGIVLGDWFVWLVKARTLLVDMLSALVV